MQISSNGLNGVSLAQLNSFGGLGMFAADADVPDESMAQYGEQTQYGAEDDPTAGLSPEQIAEVQAQAEAQAQAEM